MEQERGEILWEPSPATAAATRLARFGADHGHADYGSLHRWSIDDPGGFWSAVGDELGIIWHQRPTTTLVGTEPGAVTWFPGGRLNYAEHALAPAAQLGDELAVIERGQTRGAVETSWASLADQVARCARGLRELGVEPGDRVVAYAPNTTETLVAFLATASVGAAWASCPPEFGTGAVIQRLGQVEPKVLLAVDGYRYGTKTIDRRDEVAELRAALPSLTATVELAYLGVGDDTWTELLAGPPPEPISFEAVPADHPLYVLFSSGTTGIPKAIVHGHGGITHEHLKSMVLHHDLGPGERFCWFSTTGWMMWNYLVSGLLAGATVVLYDGDPAHPDLNTLWRLADELDVTVFGASAPFLAACRKAGLAPARGRLRQLGSTGAPLAPEEFRWIRDQLGAGVLLNSISGGTDVCTAFVGMNPLTPVRAGEISGPLLGCDVRAVAPDGTDCPPGEQGELALVAPMPSMPVAFWGDDDGSRLRSAYFEQLPGRWHHGDWITVFDDGACVISGRSDATLNRGGVRLGTADFYSTVEELPEVADSLVVHLGTTDELVLFLQAADGAVLDDDVLGTVRSRLRSDLSPRHVPDRIEVVPAVPRTLSGKKLEVPVKRLLEGADPASVASAESLADPSVFDHFVELARRREP
ncbi:MAG: acetoacetate--CoA ligase [Actinomycetota bacterium]